MSQVNWHPFKQEFWRLYRARERSLIIRGRYDDFQNVVPKTIRYDYW
jgi:hypothetical protein